MRELKMTPWEILSEILKEYGIYTGDITGRAGTHIVEDFMDLMIEQGYVSKVETP